MCSNNTTIHKEITTIEKNSSTITICLIVDNLWISGYRN